MKRSLGGVFGWASVAALCLAAAVALFGPFGPLMNLRYPLMGFAAAYLIASACSGVPWRGAAFEKVFNHPAFPWVAAAVAAVVFARIKILQWNALQISGVDFSHIDYAVWSTARGRFMEIPILPPQPTFLDFFGNHYSPVLFVHVFARMIADTPVSSLLVHAVSLAAAVPVLHALGRKFLDRMSASLLVLTYLLCGSVASTLQFEIHQESFYPLALGLVFLGLYSGRGVLLTGTVLALSIKEDAGVYLFPAFLVLAFFHPSRRRIYLALSLACAAYTILVLKVLMPMHQPELSVAPYYMPMWARYGKNFSEVAVNILTHPHWVLQDVLLNKDLYKNLLPWGFLPLLSPWGILALPPAVVSSTALGSQRSFGLYYGIVLVPFFFFASCHAMTKLRWMAALPRRRAASLILLALAAFVGGSYLRFFPASPFLPEVREAAARLATFPADTPVFVQSGLLPYLPYERRWKRIDSFDGVPPPGNGPVVLFDGISQGSLAGSPEALESRLKEKGYRLEQEGRLRVYR